MDGYIAIYEVEWVSRLLGSHNCNFYSTLPRVSPPLFPPLLPPFPHPLSPPSTITIFLPFLAELCSLFGRLLQGDADRGRDGQ